MPPGKDKEVAPTAEIGRLSALISKDPRSKLFMPLAEEYMKAGMTDQAVETLEEGLKANPFYMSARVMLGKACLEKGNTDKAREQFEQVVKTVPDNLFAHRKLGEIYWLQGRRVEAAREFRMVTILNPKDEEAKRLVELMDSGAMPATEAPSADQAVESESHSLAENDVETKSAPHPEAAETQAFDISETEGPLPEEPEPPVVEMPAPETAALAQAAEALEAYIGEPPVEAQPPLEEAPIEEAAAEALSEEEQPKAPSGYSLDISGNSGFEEILSAYAEPEAAEPAAEDTGGVYELPEDLSAFEIEGLVVKAPQEGDAFETRTLAELYCAQGFYDRAIGIYKNLLSDDPDNGELKSKLEELYWRAGVATAEAAPRAKEYPSGQDGETIRRLERFLEAVKRKAGR